MFYHGVSAVIWRRVARRCTNRKWIRLCCRCDCDRDGCVRTLGKRVSIRILNKKTDVVPANAIYVGRPSPLGNPFLIGPHGSREEVVAKYKAWLGQKLGTDPVSTEMVRLANLYIQTGELTLVCWCAPEACHGDVIKKYIQQMTMRS